MLIEIEEPGIVKHAEDDQGIVVGIDFGTTNSLIATVINGELKFATDDQKSPLVRTIVTIPTDNVEPFEIYSIKRLLGKSTEEILANPSLLNLCQGLLDTDYDIPRIKVANQLKTLPELASMVFSYLKSLAEREFGETVKKVVVTVPAYFDDSAKAAIMLSAKIAGLEVLRLIAEPTAAAYAYKLHNEARGCYLVYDLGGGTFDVSLLNMHKGVLQVIATGGDNMLGGDDLDLLVADYLLKNNLLDDSKVALTYAKKIKEHLSLEEIYTSKNFKITRVEFEQIIQPTIKRTIDITRETLCMDANAEIDGIILVGGSTRLPLITEMLKNEFKVPILANIDPDKAVAQGAALQAENLTSHNGSLIIDVLPLSLGMELYSGLVEKIILRASPLPSSITREFTTQIDNQSGVQFHILQGEREMAQECRSLAKFELKLSDAMKAGEPKIEVTFAVDTDGLLSVSATEKITGKSQIINIKPSYGLDQAEINKILEEALCNAKTDHENKLLREAQVAAKSLLSFLNNAIRENYDILPLLELKNIENKAAELELLLENDQTKNQIDILRGATEKLKKLVTHFNEVRLNAELNKTLVGRKIAEIKNYNL